MREIQKFYLKILRIELADLEEDLELLIEECKSARREHKMTEHVALSNQTLYENELIGVQEFRRLVRYLRSERFGSLGEMIPFLKTEFRNIVSSHGLATAITFCVDRKLDKVARYVMQ